VIPLVVYHGPTEWGLPLSVEELIAVPAPLERFLPNRGEELMPTLAEQWANQGREQGLAEGIEQGIERAALIGTIETCRSILGGSSVRSTEVGSSRMRRSDTFAVATP